MCVCIAESSSNEEFTEWEQGWIQQISQDEEVFEENSTLETTNQKSARFHQIT